MIKDKLELVPHLPGCYQMFNNNNQIIYVGKAKDLKKRLSSYFNGKVTGKTLVMVNEVKYFEYIITASELESFILEINLIKKLMPKYNILLTDDKSYPYIELIRKPFPKLRIVRYLKIKKNSNNKLFGPFPNSYAARKVVNLINRIYPLKKCDTMPKQVCLYYHIGECLGYCVKKIDQSLIEQMENEIIAFLNGNDEIIKNKINFKIDKYIKELNFESAKMLKEDLNFIDLILKKQVVELSDIVNRDIINYYSNNSYICIQIFFVRNGKLIGSHRDIFPITDEITEMVEQYIALFYSKHEIQKEILVPKEINCDVLANILNTKVLSPIRGEKKHVLDLVYQNAKINLENDLEIVAKDEKRTYYANQDLKKLLNLEKLDRIDIFDNSNLFGDYSVSGMVVFKNGKPAKKLYRKYKISIDKNDDYHMVKEVIYRRYYRALLEKSELPDLIIIDGGENQINATKEILNDLELNIKVIGLKKDKHHVTSELVDGDNNDIIVTDKQSDLFHYLTRIQNEVHRFTINYHRTIRSKGSIASSLDNISGLGPKRKEMLIKHFNNISNIKNATIKELEEVLPTSLAIKVNNYFNEIE